MKKPLIFILATVFFGVFVQLGCGIATEKVFTPGELVDRVTADEQGWIGKEVTVSGHVRTASRADDANGYALSLVNDGHDGTERYVDCNVPAGDAPEGIESKTVEVKGRIASVFRQNYLNMKRVKLDSCVLNR